MGRPKQFDVTEVVRSARTLFWRKGYAETSLDDLVEATGLNRSSLYHQFGSKQELFDAALRSYLEEVVPAWLGPLQIEPVLPDALHVTLSRLRDSIATEQTLPSSSGSLMLNTAQASIAQEPAIKELVNSYRDTLRAAVEAGIRANTPNDSPVEHARRAETCTDLVIAALAITRFDPQAAIRALETALAELAPTSTARS